LLNWKSSAGVTGYSAKRLLVNGGPYSLIVSNLAPTSYTDSNVVNGTTYYYVVSALNASGESTNSTEASAYVLSLLEQWQMQYFGCTNCAAAAPDADPHGQGLSNTNEFLTGTNPTNSLSGLRILSVTRQNSDMLVVWSTAGGHTNVLQDTDGNADGSYNTNFTDISPPIVIGGTGDTSTN